MYYDMSIIKLITHIGEIRKQKLSVSITNDSDLLIMFNEFSKVKKINTLSNAINRFQQYFKINFYKLLLPFIFKWAMEYDIDSLSPLMRDIEANKIFTAKEARYWLANTFIMNVDRYHKPKYGELTFVELYNGSSVGEEKLLCILTYFYLAVKLDEDREIGFYRHIITENPQTLFDSNIKINTNIVDIHVNNMESVKAHAIVNFANEQLSYGIINSCTQEEILNVCCPETYLALLFIESMEDNEIIIIKGARRFSNYTGYLHSFKWTGTYNDTIFQDQIGLDACTNSHFHYKNVNRDIMKAYTGFKMVNNKSPSLISTGLWGCGAFGGDIAHKFLQQLLAVSVIPNTKLYYSTYGNNNIAIKLNTILNFINKNNITVKQLYNILDSGDKIDF